MQQINEKPAGIVFINPLSHVNRYTLDDIGNARLFADTFKGHVVYVPEYQSWFVYDGGVWMIDKKGLEVMRYAVMLSDYVRSVIPPLQLYGKAEPDREDKWTAHRRHWGKTRFIHSMKSQLEMAQSELYASACVFDKHPLLLNMKNGTLNLQTMRLQPHTAAELLTKQANAIYDPDSRCERFERFIDEITEGRKDRAQMLQKALGYTLQGEANEECYFTAIGEKTRNGKGTLFDTVLHMLGSYGTQIDFDTIAKSGAKDGSRATPDLVRLRGVRFVLTNEPEKGVFVNEALLKQLTGNDDIVARPLYGDLIQFKPIFKLFITANAKPNVSDDSLFSSGRIKILPFTRHFAEGERDTSLKSQLREPEAISAIFNWLVQGYIMYKAEGLHDTVEMKALTDEYRRENDYVGSFFYERVTLTDDKNYRMKVSDLRVDYKNWCEHIGAKPLGLKQFKSELQRKGISVYEYSHTFYLDCKVIPMYE